MVVRLVLRCLVILTGLGLLAACAAINTSGPCTKRCGGKGVAYWMPLRQVVVTVTFSNDGAAVTAAAGAAYADIGHGMYFADIPSNWAGKTHGIIKLDNAGLLNTTSEGTFTSGVKEMFESMGTIAKSARSTATLDGGCPKTGTFERSLGIQSKPLDRRTRNQALSLARPPAHIAGGNPIYPGAMAQWQPTPGCNIEIQIERLGWENVPLAPRSVTRPFGGLAYRVNLPYLVTVKVQTTERIFVVNLPNESPTRMLAFPKGAFADNAVKATFSAGTLTEYDETNNSEAIALVQLPATILSAYFNAVGGIFSGFSGNLTSEDTYRNQAIASALEQRRREACRAAMAADDEAGIEAYCKVE